MEPTRRSRTSRRRARRRRAIAVLAGFLVLAAIVAGALLMGRGDGSSPTAHVVATPLPAPATDVVPGVAELSVQSAPPPMPEGVAERLAEAGDADQAVVVTTNGSGQTTATLSAYERVGGGWQLVLGPRDANIGSNGFAPPDEKTEGDGRTPSGSFGFDFFFGVEPDPGVQFPYREITDPSIVWDDDPASPRYNQWVDTRFDDAGVSPEPMHRVPVYSYGAVIAYNDAGTPGLGSAIFLHVSTGSATAGCVSLPVDDLLALLRWLDPSKQPRIVMGVQST